MLEETITDAQRQVAAFDELGHGPQTAIVDMVYNLGPAGFSGFRRMIADLNRGDTRHAAREMENSRWAKQVGPHRLGDDVRQIQSGKNTPSKQQESAANECDGNAEQTCCAGDDSGDACS